MIGDIPLSWEFRALMLFLCSILMFLAGFGIYYLISNKFDKIALIITSLIFLSSIIPRSLNPYHWAEFIKIYFSDLLSVITLALSFFAIFSVVNFIYRLMVKVTLR